MVSLPTDCAALYTLVRQLGAGGFGDVFLAVHKQLGREVALKVLNPQAIADADMRARFIEEARVTAQLSDPHIVKVLDHGAGEVPWIAYEYLPGRSLRDLLAQGPLPWRRALAIADQVAAALEAAHERRIVHRDIKAENVLEATADCFKVADFGIATWTGSQVQTRTGFVMGTPTHLAPEVWSGGEAGPSSDVYALGVLLYELLVGRLPFRGENVAEILKGHLEELPATPGRVQPGVPPEVSELAKRALAKDPAERFASARELRQAIDRIFKTTGETPSVARMRRPRLGPPVSRASRTVAVAAPAPASRRAWLAALAGAVALVAVVAVTRRPDGAAVVSPGAIASARPPSRDPEEIGRLAADLLRDVITVAGKVRADAWLAHYDKKWQTDPSAPLRQQILNTEAVEPVYAEDLSALSRALAALREAPENPVWAVAAVCAFDALSVADLIEPRRRGAKLVEAVTRIRGIAVPLASPFQSAFARVVRLRAEAALSMKPRSPSALAGELRAVAGDLEALPAGAWSRSPIDRPFALLRLAHNEAIIRERSEPLKDMGIGSSDLPECWRRVTRAAEELTNALGSSTSRDAFDAEARYALIDVLVAVAKLARARPDHPVPPGQLRIAREAVALLRRSNLAEAGRKRLDTKVAELDAELKLHDPSMKLEP